MAEIRKTPTSRDTAAVPESKAWMFTGATRVQPISTEVEMPYLEINILYCEAGARSRPHLHDIEQVLYFLQGPGVVAIDGGEDQKVEEGGWVQIPAGAVHMHGALSANPATYVSLIRMEHVSDFEVQIPAAWSAFSST